MTAPYVPPRNTREMRGRCHPCATSYVWMGLPRYRDSQCPQCGGALSQWHSKQRGPIRQLRPAVREVPA